MKSLTTCFRIGDENNAQEQKITKRVYDTPNNELKEVDYLDGFQYAGGVLQFFPHAEGYVNVTESKSALTAYIFNYVYNYTDHLGNIRMSYTKDPLTNRLRILEENHYYPFGLKHSVYNSAKMKFKEDEENQGEARPVYVYKTDYQYKFGNKELQDELGLNVYDFGARLYDPALGRWNVIDPMAEKYSSHSPYAYTLNNPVYFIDPDGMQVETDFKLLKNGKVKRVDPNDGSENDTSDTLYATNEDGSVDKGNSVTVQKENAKDSSLIGDLSSGPMRGEYMANFKVGKGMETEKNPSRAETTNAQDAINVFTFAAKNSNVEWGLAGFKDGNNWSFSVFTSHQEKSISLEHLLDNAGNLQFAAHSHKNNNFPSPSMGQPGDYYADSALRYKGTDHKAYLLYAPNSGSMNLWRYKGAYNEQTGKTDATRRNLGTVTQGSISLKTLTGN